MRLRPKTVRRLLLLGLAVAVLGGGGFSVIVVRAWQNQKLAARYRAEGMAAFEDRDYYAAMGGLSSYLNRTRGSADPEALLSYARSRVQIEEHDNRHIRDAVGSYRRYLAERPDDDEARRELLGYFNQIGFFVEARDAAERLRPPSLDDAGPEHQEVLREEATALIALGRFDDHLERILAVLNRPGRFDLEARLLVLDMHARRERPMDAVRFGDATAAEFPDEPAAQLVAALARLVNPTPASVREARERLALAAGLDPQLPRRVRDVRYPDAAFVRTLVEALDSIGMYEHSLAVLEDAVPVLGADELERAWMRRLWYENRPAPIVDRLAGLDVSSRRTHASLLALKALALARLGRAAEAGPIVAALGRREGDYRAKAWSLALPVMGNASRAGAPAALTALRQAVERNPREPILMAALGDAYALIGRNDDARKAWGGAADLHLSRGWALPRLRIAETLLADNRVEEAATAATAALMAAPTKVAVNVVWFEAHSARLARGSSAEPGAQAVLDRLDEAERKLAELDGQEAVAAVRERLLPCRVVLLARTGRAESARALLADAAQPAGPPLEEQTLRRLAAISQSERLGMQDGLLARAAALHGQTPTLALARASELARQGRSGEGLELLTEAAAGAPAEHAALYQLAIARYKELIGSEDALATWVSLGDRHPSDLSIQRAILESSAAPGDRAFMERSIERYSGLVAHEVGVEGAPVRLARARALLHGNPAKRERDEAVALLNSVVADQPSYVPARVMLAAASSLDNPARDIHPDLARAVQELSEAHRLEPRSASIALELARLYQLQQRFTLARERLNAVAADAELDPDFRWRAAAMLIAQGDIEPVAIRALAELVAGIGEDAPPGVLVSLADAYRLVRRDEQAAAVYNRLASRPLNDADAALATASYFASEGDDQTARKVLEEADMSADAAALLRALFAQRHDPQAAPDLFEKAVAVSPGGVRAWRAYAGYFLSRGEAEKASEIARRALQARPEDPDAAVLAEQTRLALEHGDPALRPLIDAMRGVEGYTQLRPVLEAIEAARVRGELRDAPGLMLLARAHPNSLALQLFVAGKLAGLSPPAYRQGGEIAARAMQAFPRDPAPARLAAELFMRAERWDDMLAAAQAWRSRDLSRPVDADLAVAQAQLALARPREAIQTLRRWVDGAAKAPDFSTSLGVLNIYARALVALGMVNEADSLLGPLLSSSPAMRVRIWTEIAAIDLPDAQLALNWLERVEQFIPPDSVDEHRALARAMSMVAFRFRMEDELLPRAHEVLETVAARVRDAAVLEDLGMVRHLMHDVPRAEEAYRAALAVDPDRPISLNNLANIVMETRGDLDEALSLARRALRAVPPDPAHVDTLALVHERRARAALDAGRGQEASAEFLAAADAYARVADARPGDVRALASLANCADQGGDLNRAVMAFERLLETPGLTPDQIAQARNNLAYILVRRREGNDVRRARDLAEAALSLVEHPAFRDTLGWAHFHAGSSDDAAREFRRALDREKPALSPAIGLAAALAAGDSRDRREARERLEWVDAQIQAGAVLSDDLHPILASVRDRLGLSPPG